MTFDVMKWSSDIAGLPRPTRSTFVYNVNVLDYLNSGKRKLLRPTAACTVHLSKSFQRFPRRGTASIIGAFVSPASVSHLTADRAVADRVRFFRFHNSIRLKH